MNAKVIFINEREMQATGNQYALASTVCNDYFGDVYIRLDDVIDFLQSTNNACAEEMVSLQEKADADNQRVNTTFQQAQWRAGNWILSELKAYQNKRP